MSIKRIVLPVDGSDNANHAARVAAELAAATGAELTILSVFNASAAAMMGMTSPSGKEVDEAIARVCRTHLDSASEAIGQIWPANTVSKLGNPASEIVAYAEKSKADLIVMGSRGMSLFKAAFLGSVSDKVIRTAPCPVTVVPPEGA